MAFTLIFARRRHAPELRGLEGGDRFHILGSPTATFVATAREKGLDVARAEANARKLARKQKKARRRFGTDCALGAACSFRMKHGPNDPETVVQLESGDAILFGGPARHVMHAVTDLQKGTCPAHLRDLVRGRVPGDPAEWRLNLTWCGAVCQS